MINLVYQVFIDVKDDYTICPGFDTALKTLIEEHLINEEQLDNPVVTVKEILPYDIV